MKKNIFILTLFIIICLISSCNKPYDKSKEGENELDQLYDLEKIFDKHSELATPLYRRNGFSGLPYIIDAKKCNINYYYGFRFYREFGVKKY